MDFGFVSLESLVGPPETGAPEPSDPAEIKAKLGSGFVKHERSGPEKEEDEEEEEEEDDDDDDEEKEKEAAANGDDNWRASKVAKNVDLSSATATTKAMPLSHGMVSPLALRSNSLFHGGDKQEQMLCFSSNKSEVCFLGKDGGSLAFPYCQRMPSAYNSRNAVSGYGSGSLNPTMHVPFSGVRGPFTPSQWIELEHQALIYKYITSNVPVPSNLLLPIKKSLSPFGFPASSTLVSSLSPGSFGWGAFHLGFADNSDPEPGRCRRTDGKKWRCSRDAVADQKYCERHITRGRHRSRKPVEGQQQTGQAADAASKALPMTSSAASTALPAMPRGSGSGPSNGLAAAINQHHFKGLHSAAPSNPSADPALVVNRMQDFHGGLSVLPSSSATVNLKPNKSTFVVPKQEIITPAEATSQSEFGLVLTDSLLNPSQDTSYITSKSYASSLLDFGRQEAQDHHNHPLRHFIDAWPKDDSSRPVMAWPEEIKPKWTHLSMSSPMISSDFSLSSNSPRQEKLALSPLRLSREFEPPMPMNIDLTQKQANWMPISWGSSNCTMGGPLGEVLTNTSSGHVKQPCKIPSSSLNLLTEGWDGSPQLGSSPTGVLQKSTFCSLSNSSSGSSPRADNNNNNNNKSNNVDRTSVYDEVLVGSTLGSSSVPSL